MKKAFRTFEEGLTSQRGTIELYGIGFIFSLLLTLTSYFFVSYQWLEGWSLILTIIFLGIIQMVVQLLCFLHLDSEPKPRWNLISFLFMSLVVFILVGGSLWIMWNLEGRVMPHTHLDLHHQPGF